MTGPDQCFEYSMEFSSIFSNGHSQAARKDRKPYGNFIADSLTVKEDSVLYLKVSILQSVTSAIFQNHEKLHHIKICFLHIRCMVYKTYF